jgi:ubiquinone/menaquinone biosynthesis C-methylase UbiE
MARNRPPAQTNEHKFQRQMVEKLAKEGFTPILNVASKEDPACLADFGATNLDIQQEDPSTGTNLMRDVPNFVHGDATNLPFPDKSFKLVVLGEFLEHCYHNKAVQALTQAKRVLADDGKILCTFPLDNRPAEAQHNPPVTIEFTPGCWSHHVTVWSDDKLLPLLEEVGLKITFRKHTTYILGGIVLAGRGLLLEKA